MIGHWREERVLAQDGLAVRVDPGKGDVIDSFERCMPRCRERPLVGHSAAHDQFVSVLQPSQAPSAPPRSARLEAAIASEAAEHVRQLLQAREAALGVSGAPSSETHDRYAKPYDRDAYYVAQDLAALRSQKKNSNPEPTVAQQSAALGATARPTAYTAGHYAKDAPVTSFSARLPELVFPYAFSNAGGGRAAGKEHAEALYATGRQQLETLPVHLLAPGAELSLAPLFSRFLSRLEEAGVAGLPDFTRRLQAAVAEGALAARADARGVGSILGKRQAATNPFEGNPAFVRADVFRLFLHSLGTKLQDIDLEAVVRMAAPAARAADQVPVVSLELLERLSAMVTSARG
jgi:hypothetical protein